MGSHVIRKPYLWALVFSGDADTSSSARCSSDVKFCKFWSAEQPEDAAEIDNRLQERRAYRDRIVLKLEALGLRIYKMQNKDGTLAFVLIGADQKVCRVA